MATLRCMPPSRTLLPLAAAMLLVPSLHLAAADGDGDGDDWFQHDHDDISLVVSRVTYAGNTFGSTDTYPTIFADPAVSGVQGPIHIDHLRLRPWSAPLSSHRLHGITTSFSSKSEGALMRSADGRFLTFMGYVAPVGAGGVSNSETPGATLATNTAPTYDRAVALIARDGHATVTAEATAFSGDNPRAAISVDGRQFYLAGNADSALNSDGTGPGTTIGVRFGLPASPLSTLIASYRAVDRPDETAKQHIKDNNWRAIQIFDHRLFVAKGSGGNGDNGVFEVHPASGDGLPQGPGGTITPLFSSPATDPLTGASSPYTPFGFWFADATTLYVADEGYAHTDAAGTVLVDPLAGLEKWSLVHGVWTLDYVIQDGLDLAVPEQVAGYPVPTATTGLRNLTGFRDGHGIVTIVAVTAQYSAISGGEPDPTKLVAVRDDVAARHLDAPSSAHHRHGLDRFIVLQNSGAGAVYRGVAIAPDDFGTSFDRR